MADSKSAPSTFRFNPEVKEALALIAAREGRSMANMLEWLIKKHCVLPLTLPMLSMQYFTEKQYTVNDDSCVRVDHSSYAARPAAIGSRVLVRLFARHPNRSCK